MKVLPTLFILAIAAVTVADTKSDLQAKYDEFASAFAKQDIKPFDTAMARDFVLRVGQKNQGREAVLADFKKQMQNMQNVKWVRTVTMISKGKGSQYAVIVKSVFDGDFNAGGKTSHFWNTAVAIDTWKLSGTKWTLTESRLASLDAKIDGKPAGHFPPSKKPKPGAGA